MSQEQFRTTSAFLLNLNPIFQAMLPQAWPEKPDTVLSNKKTIASLRRSLAFVNECLLVLGWGDGTSLKLLADDARARRKVIHFIIFGSELNAFAHSLGQLDQTDFSKLPNLHLHFIRSPDECIPVITRIFYTHRLITLIPGTTILEDHPLVTPAEEERAQLLPVIKKTMAERFDSLGNDVYDTFMGAKHTLSHGKQIGECRNSDHLRGHFEGQTAICIASGPSVEHSIEHIKTIQHEHVIICADTMYDGLVSQGIDPDFICMVERPPHQAKYVKNVAHKSKAHLLALPVIHHDAVEPFEERVVWWWNPDKLYPWIHDGVKQSMSGRSTGTLTIAAASMLGCNSAYLVGHDLGFSGGEYYNKFANADAKEITSHYDDRYSRTADDYYYRLFDIPANGGGTLLTSGLMEIFRSDIELIIKDQTKCSYINCNKNSGAAIEGTSTGDLPDSTGNTIDKSLPDFTPDTEHWDAYNKKCLQLPDDMLAVKKYCAEQRIKIKELTDSLDCQQTIENIAGKLDISSPVTSENRLWFQYIFRAALRNLMVKLQYNTHVRTEGQRNWNHILVMDMFCETIPKLIDAFLPELNTSLEAFNEQL